MFYELRISNACKLAGVKRYQLPSVKGFDGENRKLCMSKMFTLKQYSNNICKMVNLFPTEMYKAYPEQLVKILGTS